MPKFLKSGSYSTIWKNIYQKIIWRTLLLLLTWLFLKRGFGGCGHGYGGCDGLGGLGGLGGFDGLRGFDGFSGLDGLTGSTDSADSIDLADSTDSVDSADLADSDFNPHLDCLDYF